MTRRASRRSRTRRIGGRLAAGVLAGAVLLAAAAAGALLWLDGERLERLASTYFEETGAVEFSARRVTRTFALTPRIEVEGLVLRKAGYERPLLEVEHGAVSIALPSLLLHPIELSDIVVEQATLVLPFGVNEQLLYWGRAIGDLLSRLESSGASIDGFRARALTVDARHAAGHAETTVAAIAGTMPEPSALAFEVRRLETTVESAAPFLPGGRLELTTLSLSHALDAERPVRLDGTGRLGGWPLSLSASAGNPLEGAADARHPVDARVELAESTAALHGTVSRGADRHLAADVAVDFAGLAGWPAWQAQLELSDPGRGWLVEALEAAWGSSRLQGRMRLERGAPRPRLTGRLSLTGLEVGARRAGGGSNADGSSDPDSSGDAGGSGDSSDGGNSNAGDSSDAADDGGSEAADRNDGSGGSDDGGRAARRGTGLSIATVADRLDALDARIDVESRDMTAFGIAIPRVDLTLALEDGRLEIAPADARLLDGSAAATAALSGRPSPPRLTLDADVEQLATADLLAALGIDRDASGGIEGGIELRTAGGTRAEMLAGAGGRATLIMDGGRLSETLAQIADQDIAAALVGSVGGGDTTPIRCAVAGLDGESGVFEARTLVIDTGEVKLVGDGEIDLAERRIDLVVQPHAKDWSLLSASTPIHITGPLTSPEVSAAEGAAVASLLTPIEVGGASNAPCRQLIADANSKAEAAATADARR